jgi:hypothetical protein
MLAAVDVLLLNFDKDSQNEISITAKIVNEMIRR